jgi:hypothetical protein
MTGLRNQGIAMNMVENLPPKLRQQLVSTGMVRNNSEVDRVYNELDEFEIRMLQEKRMM